MRQFKISTIILLSSLFFASASNANTETAVETMPVSSAPVMQAGGYSNISNANFAGIFESGCFVS